jgi:hypothetical protein
LELIVFKHQGVAVIKSFALLVVPVSVLFISNLTAPERNSFAGPSSSSQTREILSMSDTSSSNVPEGKGSRCRPPNYSHRHSSQNEGKGKERQEMFSMNDPSSSDASEGRSSNYRPPNWSSLDSYRGSQDEGKGKERMVLVAPRERRKCGGVIKTMKGMLLAGQAADMKRRIKREQGCQTTMCSRLQSILEELDQKITTTEYDIHQLASKLEHVSQTQEHRPEEGMHNNVTPEDLQEIHDKAQRRLRLLLKMRADIESTLNTQIKEKERFEKHFNSEGFSQSEEDDDELFCFETQRQEQDKLLVKVTEKLEKIEEEEDSEQNWMANRLKKRSKLAQERQQIQQITEAQREQQRRYEETQEAFREEMRKQIEDQRGSDRVQYEEEKARGREALRLAQEANEKVAEATAAREKEKFDRALEEKRKEHEEALKKEQLDKEQQKIEHAEALKKEQLDKEQQKIKHEVALEREKNAHDLALARKVQMDGLARASILRRMEYENKVASLISEQHRHREGWMHVEAEEWEQLRHEEAEGFEHLEHKRARALEQLKHQEARAIEQLRHEQALALERQTREEEQMEHGLAITHLRERNALERQAYEERQVALVQFFETIRARMKAEQRPEGFATWLGAAATGAIAVAGGAAVVVGAGGSIVVGAPFAVGALAIGAAVGIAGRSFN